MAVEPPADVGPLEDGLRELGRLERFDPRTYWRDEARDFTPWLRDNIELLGEALGLEIDPTVTAEVSVGPFSADLLATDLGSGSLLLVENQLEPTDHSHLGQLLTYASGLDARLVVWVARRFRDEHQQALTWLNENTLEDLRFFGVQLELVRIGDSAFAPNLNVVAAPSEWQKSTTAARTGRTSDRAERYHEFWAGLIADLRARDPGFTSADPERAPKQNWCGFSAGRAGFQVNPVFGWESGGAGDTLRTEIYIDTGSRERNKLAFDLLQADQAAIEREFGEPLNWTRRDDIQASRIYAATPGGIRDPDTDLAQHRTWFLEHLIKLRAVFGHRIAELHLN